jgi:hypothetical protein
MYFSGANALCTCFSTYAAGVACRNNATTTKERKKGKEKQNLWSCFLRMISFTGAKGFVRVVYDIARASRRAGVNPVSVSVPNAQCPAFRSEKVRR